MLYGGKLEIYTGHKNLTFRTMSVKRIVRWREEMDEFNITLHYLPGERSVLADCFSWVPQMDKLTITEKELDNIRKNKGKLINWKQMKVPTTIDDIFVTETNISYNQENGSQTKIETYTNAC